MQMKERKECLPDLFCFAPTYKPPAKIPIYQAVGAKVLNPRYWPPLPGLTARAARLGWLWARNRAKKKPAFGP